MRTMTLQPIGQRTAGLCVVAAPALFASLPVAVATSAPLPPVHPTTAMSKNAAPATPVKLVDINGAGRKELMTLPGIGAAEADKIIGYRPYLSKTELVAKGVLLLGPYISLKNQAMQKNMNGATKAPKAAATKTAGPQASAPKAP